MCQRWLLSPGALAYFKQVHFHIGSYADVTEQHSSPSCCLGLTPDLKCCSYTCNTPWCWDCPAAAAAVAAAARQREQVGRLRQRRGSITRQPVLHDWSVMRMNDLDQRLGLVQQYMLHCSKASCMIMCPHAVMVCSLILSFCSCTRTMFLDA
jgi:hypothetical protein